MVFFPALLRTSGGTFTANAGQWAHRRKECLEILSQNVYGFLPPPPVEVRGTIMSVDKKCCAGHATLENIEIEVQLDATSFHFPIHLFMPTASGLHPVVVLLNFRPDIYDMYYPAEEIIDAGYALAVIDYQSITTDDPDMSNGVCGKLMRSEDGSGFGKISVWAWGASRALDYLLTRQEIDHTHTAIAGHSRLGKTALWCAANDERFRYVFSNDSGCGGAALEQTKHPGGETIADVTDHFGYWFCENYRRYRDPSVAMPFDQHFLIASIAPRYVEIGSASEDIWADPYSEQLGCVAASPVWEVYGLKGFVGPDTPVSIGDHFMEGNIGYHLRDGIHFLSRQDWNCYLRFMKHHW